MAKEYKDFSKLLSDHKANKIKIPKGHEFSIIIDNSVTLARIHPGWDDDGEVGDPRAAHFLIPFIVGRTCGLAPSFCRHGGRPCGSG